MAKARESMLAAACRAASAAGHHALAVIVLAAALACASPARPTDAELYLLVLSSVRGELGVTGPISIHPFLALKPTDPSSRDGHPSGFNTFDTGSVRSVLSVAPPGLYRRCSPQVGGSCEVGEGEAAVVLSEVIDLGANGVGVHVIVTDGRPGRDFHRQYMARLKAGLGGWSVVELRRLV